MSKFSTNTLKINNEFTKGNSLKIVHRRYRSFVRYEFVNYLLTYKQNFIVKFLRDFITARCNAEHGIPTQCSNYGGEGEGAWRPRPLVLRRTPLDAAGWGLDGTWFEPP